MRGRSRSGKSPNILTRNFESNGPDVKIRGTAQHIAEKYAQLARDVNAAGDPVAAENYYQHAEHYLRIIASVQEGGRNVMPSYSQSDQDFYEDMEDSSGGADAQRSDVTSGDEETSLTYSEGNVNGKTHETRNEAGSETNRYTRPQRENRGERQERSERSGEPGNERRDRRSRFLRRERPSNVHENRGLQRKDTGRSSGNAPDADMELGDTASLPAFLTTPIRPPVAVDDEKPVVVSTPVVQVVENEETAPVAPKPRRRRVAKVAVAETVDTPAKAVGE